MAPASYAFAIVGGPAYSVAAVKRIPTVLAFLLLVVCCLAEAPAERQGASDRSHR
jgi:hypothetical protein